MEPECPRRASFTTELKREAMMKSRDPRSVLASDAHRISAALQLGPFWLTHLRTFQPRLRNDKTYSGVTDGIIFRARGHDMLSIVSLPNVLEGNDLLRMRQGCVRVKRRYCGVTFS
ncbi:hypothetical protein HN011_007799 [Eciton burchellii]|nr:hypothetical protein HN011_007799 [Eciton burchellii]